MPELPEVETITRQLDSVLSGKVISRVEILRMKSFMGKGEELDGRKIKKVERRAKMIIVKFVNWEKVLVAHLKMTGQLIYINGKQRVAGGHPTPDWVRDLPSKDTRVVIELDDGSKLYFNDLRVFGWLKLLDKEQFERLSLGLPPDVVDKEFTLDYLKEALGKSGRSVKLVLMDQTKFGGVGNIYANDALYLAKINPRRKAGELSFGEVETLFTAVRRVINLGIKYGGASVDKYVNAAGTGGRYQEHFLVYQRDGEKCQRDGTIIVKMKLGGRGTFYCPRCQK